MVVVPELVSAKAGEQSNPLVDVLFMVNRAPLNSCCVTQYLYLTHMDETQYGLHLIDQQTINSLQTWKACSIYIG